MRTVCKENMCTGCSACVDVCPQKAIIIEDSINANNATIDASVCINCGLCTRICPNMSKPELKYPILWKQGWAENEIRKASSSGGAAAALIKFFIISGGYVVSCMFKEGEFGFTITNNLETARSFSGSKYVKSNPGSIYREVKGLLKSGHKVLFLGLPCQSAAVQNYCGEYLSENLYTIDLICHGTPSPRVLKRFVEELGFEWSKIISIQFRKKEQFGLVVDGQRIAPEGITDSYLRAFLKSLDYTENCYSCPYATITRVSDITLGDAWGQMADNNSEGVSLVLCQTQKGVDLVENASLHLEGVDLEKSVESNHQLHHPSPKHQGREKFMNGIRRGYNIRKAVFLALPKESVKQSIKYELIKLGVKLENIF